MIVIDYNKKHHKKIIDACVLALKKGKVLAFPTDTSYGLAVDISNLKAIRRLYKVKGRDSKKPSSIVVPSVEYVKKITEWNKISQDLAKKFWPGALTIVAKLKAKSGKLQVISANTGFLGLRIPKNNIALDLVKGLAGSITATSANVAGRPDCYSVEEIIGQYKNNKLKPDIIINAGKLKKIKPSTIVKVVSNEAEVIRQGLVNVSAVIKKLKSKNKIT